MSANDAGDERSPDGDLLYAEEYHPPFLPVLLVAFPVIPVFWKYHVKVSKDPGMLSFGYSLFAKQTIPVSTIKSAEVVEGGIHGLWEWGGWGIRKNMKWETGYISKNGPGIRLTSSPSEGKVYTYVFNCDDPERVCALLNGN